MRCVLLNRLGEYDSSVRQPRAVKRIRARVFHRISPTAHRGPSASRSTRHRGRRSPETWARTAASAAYQRPAERRPCGGAQLEGGEERHRIRSDRATRSARRISRPGHEAAASTGNIPPHRPGFRRLLPVRGPRGFEACLVPEPLCTRRTVLIVHRLRPQLRARRRSPGPRADQRKTVIRG